jgi:hypothetical protein
MNRLIIKLIGFCYVSAFISFFSQMDGLLGPNGLEPAHAKSSMPLSLLSLVHHNRIYQFMELLPVIGILLSLLVAGGLTRHPTVLLFLFTAYHACLSSGSTFYSFQWDILLLEAGFAVSLLSMQMTHISPSLLLRFILFKLMLMSGVVKLQSKCPTWLNLTACHYHFATQCLPTPMAWFFHQLPSQLLKLMTAATLFIEIPATLLILSPSRRARSLAFYLQVCLQVNIILTGNYTFFNLLTIVLCLSLFDGKETSRESWLISIISIAPVLYFSLLFFKFTGQGIELVVSPSDLQAWADILIPVACSMWAILMVTLSLQSIAREFSEHGLSRSLRSIITSAMILVTLLASIPPLFSVTSRPWIELRIWPVQIISTYTRPLYIASGYGLFRTMTGVGDNGMGGRVARPELELLGSTDGQIWEVLEFLHKPGRLYRMPTWVAPHQPRLDWQMWFAALGGPNHSPWLLHLCVRLLEGHPPDLKALAPLFAASSPFLDPSGPRLKYIKVDQYEYDFTRAGFTLARPRASYDNLHDPNATDWWVRRKLGVWMQPISLESSRHLRAALADHLNWTETRPPATPDKSLSPLPGTTYHVIRTLIQWHPVESIWAAYAMAVFVSVLQGRVFVRPKTKLPLDKKEKSE